MHRITSALLLSALVLVWSTASAQPTPPPGNTGTIEGIVSTPAGTALPGATVTVRGPTGVVALVVSEADGHYRVAGLLPPGPYDVAVALDGFATADQAAVRVAAGAPTRQGFLLIPLASEVLDVTGSDTGVPQPDAVVHQTIPDRLTHTLPLVGRDFIALASLTPGFTGTPNAPSPNGQIYWTNNVIVDGASHYSKWRSAARTFYSGYPLESVQDVQVLTSQFTAEYGEALATVTSATTRSGGNTVRGSVLLFGQAGVLNDQPAFASRKPPASTLRTGASIGAPLVRDRAFVFASYEGRRIRGNNIVTSPVAPGTAVPNDENEHLAFTRLDRRAGANDLFTLRYNGQWYTWDNQFGGLWLPGTGMRYRNDVHTALFTVSQVLSGRSVNQLRVQMARYADVRTDLDPSLYVARAGYAIRGGTLGPFGFGVNPEDTYEAADTLTRSGPVHVVKAGAGLKYVRAHNEALPFGRGAYYFAGPPSLYPEPYAFAQALPVSASSTTADPRSASLFGFVQDEWRVGDRVTLNAGLRYDLEQIHGVSGYAAPADRNNLQPRMSASWTPLGRLRVHGGAGLYTQQHLLYYVTRAQLEGPAGSALVMLTPTSPLMPAYPNVLDAGTLALVPRDAHMVSGTFRNPYSVQAAAGVQHPLFGLRVTADYIYLSGHDLMSLVDANAPASAGKPARRTVANADATRPVQPVPGGVRKQLTLGNEGRSWYHALQVKADRSSGPFQSLFTYTLARARDMANYQQPEDSRNIAAERARADTDVRHTVTAALTWTLPTRGSVFGGWTLSASGQVRSNRPYTVSWGDDRNGTTQNDARPAGRNTAKTGPYRTIDLALTRRVPVQHRTLELRAEAYNVLSTINYDEYVGALSSPLFGQPVSAFPRRRLQFAAIVRF